MHPFLINTRILGLPLILPSYAVMAVAGMVAVGIIYGWLVDGFGRMAFEHILFLGIVLLSGAVGARMGGLIIGLAAGGYGGAPWYEVAQSSGSSISFGVVIGGAALMVYARVDPHRIISWQAADALAAAFPFGHALGRIGCFLAGCCYGRVCESCRVTITYPEEWLIPRALGVEMVRGPRMASPLIAAAGLVVIGVVLLVVFRSTTHRGQIAPLYLLLYGPFRFFQEFTRGDPERGFFGPLSSGQWFSIAAVVAGGVLLALFVRRRRRGGTLPPYRPLFYTPRREAIDE